MATPSTPPSDEAPSALARHRLTRPACYPAAGGLCKYEEGSVSRCCLALGPFHSFIDPCPFLCASPRSRLCISRRRIDAPACPSRVCVCVCAYSISAPCSIKHIYASFALVVCSVPLETRLNVGALGVAQRALTWS